MQAARSSLGNYISAMSRTSPSHPASRHAPWQPCGATHVAVYGTLRAGGVNDIARLHAGIRRTGVTELRGTLHDLGWYPGLSLAGTHAVLAEVYPLNDTLEQAMDRIEGIWPQDLGEYAKRLVDVRVMLADGDSQLMRVLAYEALPAALKDAPVIMAHDWLAWYRSMDREHPDQPFQLKTENSAGPSAG